MLELTLCHCFFSFLILLSTLYDKIKRYLLALSLLIYDSQYLPAWQGSKFSPFNSRGG